MRAPLSTSDAALPLRGVRVLDLTDGPAGRATRLLADLGADVLLVEPPGGVASRRHQPLLGATSFAFVTTHWNKRSVAVDIDDADGRDEILRLAESADIVVEGLAPGYLAGRGLGKDVLRQRNPSLVHVSVTDFGQTGPYRDWRGSESVFVAMSSALTRSGAPGREPLLPPGSFATETAAVQAAFAALLAYLRSLRTGEGDYVDCSLFDMTVQGLDPAFGMAGSATQGQRQDGLPLGRPDMRMRYPIIGCVDGHVRICLLAPKQWRSMFEWLGSPAEFADSAYDKLSARYAAWNRIKSLIEDLFAASTRTQLVEEGTRRGVPIAALESPAEILSSEHIAARASFFDTEIAPGITGSVPSGCVEFDGHRAGFRAMAPESAAQRSDWRSHTRPVKNESRHLENIARPLQGLRVIDLGVIVVGGDTGRLLADQGADVIKVENVAFADGARQGDRGDVVSYGFAVGNRGKRSLGLNLRSPEGADLFCRLAAQSDVVLSNFRPGTMESLGLDYDALRSVNPGLVVVESSALGSSGPWSRRMGYGPLVRSTVGLTTLWRHADSADAFGDDMTVYPDHAAARVGAAATVAALIARRSTGRGCMIGIAQMETVFMQLAAEYLRESIQPGSLQPRDGMSEFDAPSGIFACLGEDAYCAVTVDGDDDWLRLAAVIGRSELAANADYATAAGRVAHRAEIDAALQAWTSALEPDEVARRLQAAGIAAGAAAHVRSLPKDAHLQARDQFAELPQPGLPQPVVTESGPAIFDRIPAPEPRPAPLMGEHSRVICRHQLGMTDAEIDALVAAGVVQEHVHAADDTVGAPR